MAMPMFVFPDEPRTVSGWADDEQPASQDLPVEGRTNPCAGLARNRGLLEVAPQGFYRRSGRRKLHVAILFWGLLALGSQKRN